MIVAEIGLNHLGDEKFAEKLVKKVIKSKVEAITFQVREKEFYKNQFKKYLLSDNFYIKIKKICKEQKVKFGIALADINKVDFFKIIRDDIKNKKLIKKILDTNSKNIFVSTGMANTKDISNFFKLIKPINKKKITLIHTQLNYRVENVNLESINFLRNNFKCKIAYGNHCNILEVIYMSLVYNPDSIFFYVKDMYKANYLDNLYALNLDNAKIFTKNIKLLKKAIGTFSKFHIEKNLKL